MEKVLISGAKAVIRTNSGERAEALSNILWTYKPDTFLPHGTARDGNADKQPIWITPDEENPNCAEILVLTDGASAGDVSTWQKCIEIFNQECSNLPVRLQFLDFGQDEPPQDDHSFSSAVNHFESRNKTKSCPG